MRPRLTGAAIPIHNPALPPIVAALPVGLIAPQRKARDPVETMAARVVRVLRVHLMTWVAGPFWPMPLVYVGAMWPTCFAGFRMIRRTGGPMRMLIVIVAGLMLLRRLDGSATALTMRDGFVQAALVAAVIGPLVYLVLPACTCEKHVDDPVPVPGPGNVKLGAAIRATVPLGLSFRLYLVMQPSDMMVMAMVAAMVIVFPTQQWIWSEAGRRVGATFHGAALAAAVLWGFPPSPHLPVLLGTIFLAGAYPGSRMLSVRRPSMVCPYGYLVMPALVAGALSAQDPAHATFTRVVLTLVGAFAAALAVAPLDAPTDWRASGGAAA